MITFLSLGDFCFSSDTALISSLNHVNEWRFDEAERFDAMPALQFLGAGSEKISLAGNIWGGSWGKYSAINTLVSMGDAGEQYSLLDGNGYVYGDYVIRSISRNKTLFLPDGTPRKVDFTIELTRAPDAAETSSNNNYVEV